MPLAVCVKSTGVDIMRRYFPDILAVRSHQRMDGKFVRYLRPAAATLQTGSALVSHMVFPRYTASAATEIHPIARSAALRRMMSECWACGPLDRANITELIRWIGQIECYELTFSSLERAADLVQQVAPLKPES